MIQVVSKNDADDIIYVPLKKQHLIFKGSRQPPFVPGGIEVRNVWSSRHSHGKAIGLPNILPTPVNLGPEDKVILLNRKQITYVICLHSPSTVPAKVIIHEIP